MNEHHWEREREREMLKEADALAASHSCWFRARSFMTSRPALGLLLQDAERREAPSGLSDARYEPDYGCSGGRERTELFCLTSLRGSRHGRLGNNPAQAASRSDMPPFWHQLRGSGLDRVLVWSRATDAGDSMVFFQVHWINMAI